MSGNKVKLQLSRNISLNDKSPSPSKLMINHGKPNFTINRQNSNYKKYHVDTELKPNEIDKVVLKTVPFNDTQSVKENINYTSSKTTSEQEFLQKFKQISVVKTENIEKKTYATESEITHKNEFLDKFQRISEKLSTRNIDSIETSSLDYAGNTNGNNCVYNMKNEKCIKKPNISESKVEPQFAKMVDNRVHNAEIKNSGFKLPPGAICGKPYIPTKPVGLVSTPPPSVISNGNGTLLPMPLSNGESTLTTTVTKNDTNCHVNTNGVNFEQKTVVSFSKDLSTAPNTYPDTAKVVTEELQSNFQNTEIFNEISKLKFDIETTGNDVIVTSVIR